MSLFPAVVQNGSIWPALYSTLLSSKRSCVGPIRGHPIPPVKYKKLQKWHKTVQNGTEIKFFALCQFPKSEGCADKRATGLSFTALKTGKQRSARGTYGPEGQTPSNGKLLCHGSELPYPILPPIIADKAWAAPRQSSMPETSEARVFWR